MAVQDVLSALMGGGQAPQNAAAPLPTLTPESIKRRRMQAMLQQKEGMSYAPVQHWTQGAARVSQALLGALDEKDLDKQEATGLASATKSFNDIIGGGGGAAPAAANVPSGGTPGPAAPTFAMAGGGDPMSQYIAKTRGIESAGNDAAVSPTGATGRYQFTKGTWGDVAAKNPDLGLTPDGRLDPVQQEKAMAALTSMNGKALSASGVPVNPGTLYLAHQQGAAGAAALLKNPDAPAAQALASAYNGDMGKAARAIAVNGGDPSAPARVFAQKWMSKFGGGVVAPPATGDNMAVQPPAVDPGMAQKPVQVASADPSFVPQMAGQRPPQQMAQAPQAAPSGAGVDQGNPMVAQVTQLAAQPQVQQAAQAHAQTPEGQKMVQQAGGASLPQIMQAMQNPWMSEGQRSLLLMVAKQKMEAADPVRQRMQALEVQGKELGIQQQQQALRGGSDIDVEAKRIGIEKARKDLDMPNGEVLRDDSGNPIGFFDKQTLQFKQIQGLPQGSSKAPVVHSVKQPDGSEVAVQWDRNSNSWVPLKAPEGGNALKAPVKLTEGQSKDLGFYTRGNEALKNLEPHEQALIAAGQDLKANVPGVGNYLVSKEYQLGQQAGREFLAAMLRKDSGGAITKEEEDNYGRMYLPRPGDQKEVLDQKRVARQRAMDAIKSGLGTAEVLAISKPSAAPASAAPASGGFKILSVE